MTLSRTLPFAPPALSDASSLRPSAGSRGPGAGTARDADRAATGFGAAMRDEGSSTRGADRNDPVASPPAPTPAPASASAVAGSSSLDAPSVVPWRWPLAEATSAPTAPVDESDTATTTTEKASTTDGTSAVPSDASVAGGSVPVEVATSAAPAETVAAALAALLRPSALTAPVRVAS
ncbi:hypothetical protein IFT36_16095, partial [Frigoribacterium sp. CFBP 13605]|nr:hypothetical protein [Frigoribacterium sp. CFBP 13605]